MTITNTTTVRGEDILFLVATGAFFAITVWFLALILLSVPGDLAPRIALAVISFVFALICFTVSPRNQARTLRILLDRLPPEKSAVEEVAKLQRSVGAAGFFNRIGLTGIPLTVALFALVFCGLSFLARKLSYDDGATAFLELTKLTVGAFIGSLTRTGERPNAKGGV
jgi:hypothetical protein